MLVHRIDHEERVGEALHVLDAPKSTVHLAALPLEPDTFLLGQMRLLIAEGRLDVFEALNRFADGTEVGHGPAQPPVIHVEHSAALGLLADSVLSLTLGAHEKHVAPVGREIADELGGVAEIVQCLLQVDDVDTVPLAENERLHLRVPTPCLVPEMYSGFEQLLHLNFGHGTLPYLLENWKRLRALGCPGFFRSTLRASRVRKPTDFSFGRSSALNSSRAREMPWRIAPA